MISCLCKALVREDGETHFFKIETLEIRGVIQFFCKKGMPFEEIHQYFMKTLGKESPSYSKVKNWQQSRRGRVRALRMMDGLTAPKMKMSRLCTP